MKEQGVDALILLGNGNVVYATGASWPLLDAGLSHVERPVAIVLADDEHPHLFMPFREGSVRRDGAARRSPASVRSTSNSTRASSISSRCWPAWSRPGATVAVDELTGAMRRAAGRLFPAGPPADAALVVGAGEAGEDHRPDRLHPQGLPDHRAGGRRRPEVSWHPACARWTCRRVRAPRIRTRRHHEHDRGDLAGDARPRRPAGVWTTTGDLALPLLHHRAGTGQGRRAVDRRVSITYDGYCSDFGRTWLVGPGADRASAGALRTSGARSSTRCSR